MAAVILFWNTKMAAVTSRDFPISFPGFLSFALSKPGNDVNTFPLFCIPTYPGRGNLLDSVSLSCAQKVSKDE